MHRAIVALGLAGTAAAFAPSAGLPGSVRRAAAVEGPKMAVMPGSFSDSVPFLKQPTNLDGSLPGDVGFDPLGFSEVFDIKVLREAELKHGRIAMLAVLGWTIQETAPASIHPGFPTLPPIEAHDVLVKSGGMSQILLWTSFLEIFGGIALFQTIQGKRYPGDFQFDPLGLSQGNNAGKFEQYQLAEIKHSRLAMLAFSGFTHQYFATKQGVFEQLGNFKSLEGAAGPFVSDKVLGQIF